MDSFIQDHEVEHLRCENRSLQIENTELRKMVGLMQENLELRYALRDHGTMVHELSPTPLSKDQRTKPGMAASHKASGSSAVHLKWDVVGPQMGGHGKNGIGGGRSAEHGGGHNGTHGGGRGGTHEGRYGSGHSSLKDSSSSKSPTSSLDSQPEQHITGHRKLIASVTKLRTRDKARVDSAKGNQMQRRMVEEG